MPLSAFLLLLVLACATFRLSELVVYDAGPFELLLRLRAWTGLYDLDANGSPFLNAGALRRWLGGVMDCPHCAGIYFAGAGALGWSLLVAGFGLMPTTHALVLVPVVWLGLAGLQSALSNRAGRTQP